MSTYTIISYPGSPAAHKALIAAEFGGIADQIAYPTDFKFAVDNKTEDYLSKVPTGKVPALTTPEGTVFESNAMARYIARKGNNSAQLLGADAFQQSIIDAWIDFTAFYLNDVYPLFAFLKGYGQYNAETFQKSQEKQATAWGQIEAHLKRTNNKFLTGDAISLADIIMISTLYMPLQLALDAEFRSAYPKTEAMFRSLCDTEQVKKVIGDIQFVEKFTAPQ